MKPKAPTYIATVEKAIVEKYGTEAAQDFRSKWKPAKEKEYLGQLHSARQQKEKRKKKKIGSEPRTCPVCKTYSFSPRDDLYMNRFLCCRQCYLYFVVYREEQWGEGWRPNEEDIEISLRRRK